MNTFVHDFKSVAYHEAGHAVSAYRLLPDIEHGELSILPNEKEGTLGHLIHEKYLWSDDDEIWRNMVTIYLSGYAASFAAESNGEAALLGCGSDFDKAENIIVAHNGGSLRPYLDNAIVFMRKQENKTAVEVVAEELLRRRILLKGETKMLIDFADGAVGAEVLSHWRLVTNAEELRQTRLARRGAVDSQSLGL